MLSVLARIRRLQVAIRVMVVDEVSTYVEIAVPKFVQQVL